MKLTKTQLKQIIKEEIESVLAENLLPDDRLRQILSDMSHEVISIEDARAAVGRDPDGIAWVDAYENAKQELDARATGYMSQEEEEYEDLDMPV